MLAAGRLVSQIVQQLGVSEQTYARWRTQYGGMKADEARRLKELEIENTRLKSLIADQALDMAILKEANTGGLSVLWLLRAVAGIALAVCIFEAWMFYSDPAPFHQLYTDSTESQNAAVTYRLIAALMGVPATMIAMTLALAGPRLRNHARRWLLVVAAIGLLAAAQAFAVRLSLPYGFGSGYGHASASQRSHLRLSTFVGVAALLLSVATVRVRASKQRE